jgi:predicted lipid-binding transport protein (Tim44 family)
MASSSPPSFEPQSSLWPAFEALRPLPVVRHGSGVRPQPLLDAPSQPAPNLRTPSRWGVGLAIVFAIGLVGLGTQVLLGAQPAAPIPLMVAAPAPVKKIAPRIAPPVAPLAAPAHAVKSAPAPNLAPAATRAPEEKPAAQARAVAIPARAAAHPSVHHARHHAAPAAPRSTIKEGRIVDPFAGM